MSEPRLLPRVNLPVHRKPDESLKLLAGSGATPRQMLWGLWWCHTMPSLFKSLAAVGCAGLIARVIGSLIAAAMGVHGGTS
jgi:ABC-type nitrate/sulfonate/bicarbonate transport system permease component